MPMKVKQKAIDWEQRLAQESVRVEWKENVADELGVVKTLCAFANDIQQVGGGQVICGIREEKDRHGTSSAKVVGLESKRLTEIKNKVLSICRDNVEPPLVPAVEEYPVRGNPAQRVLVFAITASQFAHRYKIKDQGVHYYVRINDRTQQANGLIPRLLEQKKSWPPYLEQIHPDATLKAINLTMLEEFLSDFKLPQPIKAYLKADACFRGDVRSLFTHPSGGSRRVVPRNFAIVLFGREPHLFFRGAYAIFSVYQGNSVTAERNLRHELFGPIPILIRSIMDTLQAYMGWDIDKGIESFEGRNQLRFSSRAVQEAIVNAFVHRDYTSYEPVRVTVFEDRIEVLSPGIPSTNMGIEKLNKGNVLPSWRNPSLAWFMVALQYAQNGGQGIKMIIELTTHIAGKPPIFDVNGDWFQVIIPAFIRHEEPARPINGEGTTGKECLILISIGGDSIEKQVGESLAALGLKEKELVVAVNYVYPEYIDGVNHKWEEIARQLKNEIQRVVESNDYEKFHLFYRGPVALVPPIGALIAPHYQLFLYNFENGRYNYTYTIDRKFLKS